MNGFRTQLLDLLITEFKNLTYEGTSNKLFYDVKALFKGMPAGFPVGTVLPLSNSIEVVGNDTDLRDYGFSLEVMEYMENNLTDAQAKTRIDRVGNIEDQIYDYLEKIPNNLEREVENCHVVQVLIDQTQYNFQETEKGIALIMEIDFRLQVSINVFNL